MLQSKIQSGEFGDPNSDDYAGKVADWARGNLPLTRFYIAQSALKTQSDKTLSAKFRCRSTAEISHWIRRYLVGAFCREQCKTRSGTQCDR